MSNQPTITLTNGVPTAPSGTVSSLDAVFDVTHGPAAIKAASTAAVATDPAIVVALSPNNVNANGSATSANSAPVVIASDQAAVAIKAATTAIVGLPAALGNTTMSASMPVTIASDQSQVLAVNRFFSVAATTLTRPADTNAYAAGDSVSNSTTAGSVTALVATVSSANDAPILVSSIALTTSDTGVGVAAVQMRAYIYNSDPTASSGVKAGDNAAFSNNKAGLVGTFVGNFTTMADGGVANMVPESGAPFIVCNPGSGAETLWIQYQIAAGAPTPQSASTFIGTLRGIQGHA